MGIEGKGEVVRSRLLRALSESDARVRLIIGPAGYGKSTLARQFTASQSSPRAWLGIAPGSSDVASIAARVADCLDEIVPTSSLPLRTRLAATSDPGGEARVLGEIAAEATFPWPDGAWFVLDDYHEVQATSPIGEFLGVFALSSRAKLVVASRRRPAWVSERSIVYGETSEIGQSDLALDEDETKALLGHSASLVPHELLLLADGWPAVISLAAQVQWREREYSGFHQSLYSFFAEEVFRSLSSASRDGLPLLAGIPAVDPSIARTVLGGVADHVLQEAMAIGIMSAEGGAIRLHPLAKSYLSSVPCDPIETSRVARVAVDEYVKRGWWESAASVLEAFSDPSLLDRVFDEGLSQMLDAGQIETVRRLVRAGDGCVTGRSRYRKDVAEAEVELRAGNYASAQLLVAQVEQECPSENPGLLFSCHMIRGRCAHMLDDFSEAAQSFRSAAVVAPSDDEQREALWSALMCSIGLEEPSASELLGLLTASTHPPTSRDVLRLQTNRIMYQIRFGGTLDIATATRCAALLARTSDLFVTTGFRLVFAHALTLTARYDLALQQADDQAAAVRAFRLEFASPHVRIIRATALSGLRRYSDALEELSVALEEAERLGDTFSFQNHYSALVRTLVQSGEIKRAMRIAMPSVAGALPCMRGEVHAARALVLALDGAHGDAAELCSKVEQITRSTEARLVARAAGLVSSLRSSAGAAQTMSIATSLFGEAIRTGVVDPAVCALRAAPDLLAWSLSSPGIRDTVAHIVQRARDWDALVGSDNASAIALTGDAPDLTRREREVFDLLVSGCTNAEIADALVISRETAKLHVHHIYDKLGVRSRTALAVAARLQAIPQAASRALASSDSTAVSDQSVQ